MSSDVSCSDCLTLLDLELEVLREILEENVPDRFRQYIPDFIEFVRKLVEKIRSSGKKSRSLAIRLGFLLHGDGSQVSLNAKINAFYAYLVHRGVVTAYYLVSRRYVAGGGSLYKWIRLYRELNV